MGRTVGQVALGQLAAVSAHAPGDVETRARCLSLMGKYFRLLAVQEDPIYLSALWDRHGQVCTLHAYLSATCRVLSGAVLTTEPHENPSIIEVMEGECQEM